MLGNPITRLLPWTARKDAEQIDDLPEIKSRSATASDRKRSRVPAKNLDEDEITFRGRANFIL